MKFLISTFVAIGFFAVTGFAKTTPAPTAQKNAPAAQRKIASYVEPVLTMGTRTAPLDAATQRSVLNYIKSPNSLKTYAGMGQGWVSNIVVIRCSEPEGTGDPSHRANCEYVEATLPESPSEN